MTNEQRKAQIAGYLEERRGYEKKVTLYSEALEAAEGAAAEGEAQQQLDRYKARLSGVEATLKDIGYKAKTPAKRSTKLTPKPSTKLTKTTLPAKLAK